MGQMNGLLNVLPGMLPAQQRMVAEHCNVAKAY